MDVFLLDIFFLMDDLETPPFQQNFLREIDDVYKVTRTPPSFVCWFLKPNICSYSIINNIYWNYKPS